MENIFWKPVDLSMHNPIWEVLSVIIKDDRLKYNKDKPVIDILFKFGDKDHKARITNYDEETSTFDVYCRTVCRNPRPAPADGAGGEKDKEASEPSPV